MLELSVPIYRWTRTQVLQKVGKSRRFISYFHWIHPVQVNRSLSLPWVRRLRFDTTENGVSLCRTHVALLNVRWKSDCAREIVYWHIVQLKRASAVARLLQFVVGRKTTRHTGIAKKDTWRSVLWLDIHTLSLVFADKRPAREFLPSP